MSNKKAVIRLESQNDVLTISKQYQNTKNRKTQFLWRQHIPTFQKLSKKRRDKKLPTNTIKIRCISKAVENQEGFGKHPELEEVGFVCSFFGNIISVTQIPNALPPHNNQQPNQAVSSFLVIYKSEKSAKDAIFESNFEGFGFKFMTSWNEPSPQKREQTAPASIRHTNNQPQLLTILENRQEEDDYIKTVYAEFLKSQPNPFAANQEVRNSKVELVLSSSGSEGSQNSQNSHNYYKQNPEKRNYRKTRDKLKGKAMHNQNRRQDVHD